MNEIYKKAHSEANGKKPIFLANLRVSKSKFFGTSKVAKKEFFDVKKIICSGTIDEIKADKRVLFSALVLLLGDKEKANKATAYKLEGVEVISFHGYNSGNENN